MDGIVLLLGIPVAFILSGWAGRMAQRKIWKLNLPYEDRLRAL